MYVSTISRNKTMTRREKYQKFKNDYLDSNQKVSKGPSIRDAALLRKKTVHNQVSARELATASPRHVNPMAVKIEDHFKRITQEHETESEKSLSD